MGDLRLQPSRRDSEHRYNRTGDVRGANPISIDLTDSCNVNCVNCLRALRKPLNNPEHVMPLEIFKRIIDKSSDLGFSTVLLYNWTEPFLYPEIEAAAGYAREKMRSVRLSSNLSLKTMPFLLPTLRHCDELIVSVSGYTREMHARNHRGSEIATVKGHLEKISAALREGEISTRVIVRYLEFGYNKHEAGDFQAYAADLGLAFHFHPGSAYRQARGDFDEDVTRLFHTFRNSYSAKRRRSLMARCAMREVGPVIDYNGDMYVCCKTLNTPFMELGNFLDDDFLLLEALRQTHPYCAICGHETMVE